MLPATLEIDTFALPVFVMVSDCVAVLPAVILAKLKPPGFTLMVDVAVTPVPLNGTIVGEFGALLTIVTAPVTLPAACGAYCTLKFPLWPGARVIGNTKPLKPNPVPVTDACEIVRLAVPLFFICTVCEFVLPETTDPKLTVDGVTLKPA